MTVRRLRTNPPNPLFAESVLLALVSAFAYFVAYLYERGFAEAFGIPPELIDLKWTTVFAAGFGVLLAISCVTFISVVTKASRKLSDRSKRIVRTVTPYFVSVAIFLAVFGWSRASSLFLLMALTIASLESLKALVSLAVSAVRKRTSQSEAMTKEGAADELLAPLLGAPAWFVRLVLIMVGSLPIVMLSGRVKALDMRDFLVTANPTSQAVLRIYGDKIVTAQYDRAARTLIPVYHVLPLADTARTFTLERLPQVAPMCPHALPVPPEWVQEDSVAPKTIRGRIRKAVMRVLIKPQVGDPTRCSSYLKTLAQRPGT
jgi:hypothetical protein